MADIPLLTFDEARDYFRALVPMTEEEWVIVEEEIRLRAFTVANVASMDALLEIYNALDKRLSDGTTYQEFQQQILTVFEDRGWIAPEPYRLENLFDTNIQSAYGHGRLVQHSALGDLYPYGEYATVGDDRVRPHHRELEGQIHLMDSDFWRIHYPPWEFRCRCSCIPRSREEVEGQEISFGNGPSPERDFQGPGYGFGFGDPDQAVRQLMPNAPAWARSQVRARLEDPEIVARSKELFEMA